MKRFILISAFASLLGLVACSKEDASSTSSETTAIVTTVDEEPTIIQEVTTRGPDTVDGPAMDSIKERMPPV